MLKKLINYATKKPKTFKAKLSVAYLCFGITASCIIYEFLKNKSDDVIGVTILVSVWAYVIFGFILFFFMEEIIDFLKEIYEENYKDYSEINK